MKIDFHGHNPSASAADHFVYCHANLQEPLPKLSQQTQICFGLHPWFLPETWEKGEALLEEWSKHPQFFSLGECGLDRRNGPEFNIQKEFFIKQLEWATKRQLPFIVLHSVRANNDCWGLIKKSSYRGKIVFHDYKDNSSFTNLLLKEGRVYFSLGTALDGKGQFLKELPLLEKNTFLSRVLLETDASDTPISKRYWQLSKELLIEPHNLEKIIEDNFHDLTT